ncbi:MAG: penicillin-binding transpeptidase domain-containing protein [Clostridium sp.]
MDEEKKYTSRYVACVLILLAIFVVFGIQLINWQIVHGSEYREKADSTNQYSVEIQPLRGEILDVNGVDLAINITGYQVVFDSLYMTGENRQETNQIRNDTILKLVGLFERRGEEWIDILPITLDADGNFVFKSDEDSEADVAALKSFYRMQGYATAQECMDVITGDDHYKCSDLSNEDKLKVASVRYNMEKSGFNAKTKYVFADNVSQDMVAIVEENHQKLPGVFSKTVPTRKYVNGDVAPHLIGTLEPITAEAYENADKEKYNINSKVGASGVEGKFEDILVGTKGEKIVETTPSGSILNVKEVENSQPGETIYLTLDARMQRVAAKALEQAVQGAENASTNKSASIKYSGAVVALRVKDFSVLCAQSYPTYDLTRYTEDPDYKLQILQDNDHKPMLGRALNGTYPIGSSIKPAVASAALQEGVITRDTTINCIRKYVFSSNSDDYALCMGYHGPVALNMAMAVSCNYYFFDVGRNLGIDSLNQYLERFGLGEYTGVELNEAQGRRASPETSERLGKTWYGGDILNASIGQGDDAFTPIQLATYAATIANNGVRLQTHIVDKKTDYSRQNVIEQYDSDNPNVIANTEVSPENQVLVKEAMRQVVINPRGTANHYFGDYPIPVAAKTGTAQLGTVSQNIPDHTTFIAFAPYDDPEIAVAVVIEHGVKTQFPADVAKAIFDAYFFGTGMEEIAPTNPDGSTTPIEGTDSSSQADASSSNEG